MTPSSRPIDGDPDQSERLREIGRVTGELLHDLVGMLSVLLGRVTLVREALAEGRTREEDLTRIQSAADEIRRMVAEVLDELHGRRPSPEVTFAVTGTLEEVVSRWRKSAPAVTVTLESALPEVSEVAGPRSYFVRIMVNLLRNAERHARSHVRLSSKPVRDGAWVEILVDDDGDGVPRELEGRLFEPFITGDDPESEPGTGLGLSVARWASERLGGELTLVGRARGLGGASFRVLLPLAPLGHTPTAGAMTSESDSPGVSRRDRSAPLATLSVAVVDDDAAVRRVFDRLLARSGARFCEVDPHEATTPEEIVDHLIAEGPNVVLLDLDLGPLSGVQVYDALAEVAPDLAERVLFLTGDTAADPPRPRPLVDKLVTWDELSARVLEVARIGTHPSGAADTVDGPGG